MIIIEERRLILRQAVPRSITDCPTLEVYTGDIDRPVILAMEMGCPEELYRYLIDFAEPKCAELGLVADSRGRHMLKGLLKEELVRLVCEGIVNRHPTDYLKWVFDWPMGKTELQEI